ncbi:MAG: hypothetical protein AB8G86_28195 [Saprospiraceae bacterium]
MKPNILLLEYISSEALTILKKHTNVQVATTPATGMDIATKMPIDAIGLPARSCKISKKLT